MHKIDFAHLANVKTIQSVQECAWLIICGTDHCGGWFAMKHVSSSHRTKGHRSKLPACIACIAATWYANVMRHRSALNRQCPHPMFAVICTSSSPVTCQVLQQDALIDSPLSNYPLPAWLRWNRNKLIWSAGHTHPRLHSWLPSDVASLSWSSPSLPLRSAFSGAVPFVMAFTYAGAKEAPLCISMAAKVSQERTKQYWLLQKEAIWNWKPQTVRTSKAIDG